jgi:hypothetical protein
MSIIAAILKANAEGRPVPWPAEVSITSHKPMQHPKPMAPLPQWGHKGTRSRDSVELCDRCSDPHHAWHLHANGLCQTCNINVTGR